MNATKKSVANSEKCKNSDYGNGLDWQYCGICGGRVHRAIKNGDDVDCSTKKKLGIDCLDNPTDEEYDKAGY